jgi:hypothetical protein
MPSRRDGRILILIKRLSSDICFARQHSLDSIAYLLELTLLELKLTVHQISDHELKEFSRLLERDLPQSSWD